MVIPAPKSVVFWEVFSFKLKVKLASFLVLVKGCRLGVEDSS